MSQFIYLLNAMENAAQQSIPFKAGYGEKRAKVLRYVEELERDLELCRAVTKLCCEKRAACEPQLHDDGN